MKAGLILAAALLVVIWAVVIRAGANMDCPRGSSSIAGGAMCR